MGEIARKFFVAAAIAAFAQLLVAPAVLAAGLGRLNVLSALGEPLKAEIEIVSLQTSELDSLSARLASNQAYRQSNIDLNGALLGVKFAIENHGGQYVVSLSSVQPMNEPFIDMLVELTWNSGRLVREYTFLLDPPEYRGPAPAGVLAIEPPAVQATPVAPPPEAPIARPVPPVSAPAQPATETVRPAPAATSKPAAAASRSGGSYEVKRGDTLAKIAQSNAVDGASLQQMLVALYRNNPDAFDGGNMNRLRAGRILNLPDRDTATAVSVDDARREVNTQGAAYAKYRSSLGEAVASAPARPETGRQVSGRVGAPADDKAAAPKEAPKDQLRLSRPEDAAKGAAAKGGAAKAAAADDAAAKEKAVKEANERIALLEKNISAMKSQSGAQLQQQAQAAKAPAKAEPSKAEAKAPAAAEPPKPEAAKAAEPAKAADAAKAPAADAAKAETPAAPPVPDAAAPKAAPKAVTPPPQPAPEVSFTDELLGDPMTLYGGAAVLVLLAGYAIYAVRKKRKQAAAASSTSISSMPEPSFANSMLASRGVEDAESTSEEALAEAGPGAIAVAAAESEEIDPVAEADVYMAYGRDAQAEEILKEALARDPSRQVVRLKLLEIYANRKDKAGFESTARELHEATGGQGADWEKAAALGAAIDPDNSLYSGAVAKAAPAGVTDTQVMPVMGADVTAPAPDVVLDAGPAEAAPALDFDLGSSSAMAEAPAAAPVEPAPASADAPTMLDFDLDLGDDQPAQTAAPVAAAPASDGLSIDFELPDMEQAPAAAAPETASDDAPSIDFDLGSDAPATPAAEEPSPMLDLSSISLDLGSPETSAAEPNAQWQEVATKLDLAKAYHDMGDKDGARELLNEVLKEGDAAQQDHAKTMLEALG